MEDVSPPKVLTEPLVVPEKTLMGPGPSNCHPRVMQALSRPIIGHMHPETLKVMDDVKEGIRYIFQTKNQLTLAVSASGHGGMETVLCNLLEEGDTALIGINGIWGERAAQMARNYGAKVVRLEVSVGQNFSLAQIKGAISKHRPKLFFVAQGESSSGVYQNLEGVGDICHRFNCLLAVDTVASLGGVPLYVDRWGIDAIYTGSQKCLGGPAGITPISFSARAQKVIFSRKTPVKVFYLDMTILGQYWACFGSSRFYHHTISTPLLFGLREALAMFAEEGLENVVRRHQACTDRLYAGLKKLNCEFFIEDEINRLPTVTTIKVPSNVDWRDVCGYAMKTYNLEFSGGLGPTFDKVFRFGVMGYNAYPDKVDFLLRVFEESQAYSRLHKQSKL